MAQSTLYKQPWSVWLPGLLFLFTYGSGELWNLADQSKMHTLGGVQFDGYWYYYLMNERINRLVELAAFYIMWRKPDRLHIGYIVVYAVYRIADLCLFFYNGNTSGENYIYLLCGITDCLFLGYNSKILKDRAQN